MRSVPLQSSEAFACTVLLSGRTSAIKEDQDSFINRQSKQRMQYDNQQSVFNEEMDMHGSDNDVVSCRTTIVLSENVDSVVGPFRVRYDSSDGNAIKIRSRRVCIRHQFDGRVHDNYVCRTDVTKESKVEMDSGSVKCSKVLRLGKYHNRLVFDIDFSKSKAPSGEETGEVIHAEGRSLREAGINNERSNRLGRMMLDRRGNCMRSGRIIKRRRSRRRVCLEKFVLFDQDGNIIGSKGNGGESGLEAQSGRGVTDLEKFEKSVDEAMLGIGNLDMMWPQTPYFRCSGGKRRHQKFVCTSTVRTRKDLGNGQVLTTVLLSIVVEEESTKIRDINFRTMRVCGENGELLSQKVTSFCSCDVEWDSDGIGSSSCWHVKCFRENEAVLQVVSGVMEEGFKAKECKYYGDIVSLMAVGSGSTRLSVVNSTTGSEAPLSHEGGIVVIQLDNVRKADLTTRGNRIGKKRSIWKVIDVREGYMTTVLWRPVSIGIGDTRMTCVMCRSSQGRKCKHELECELESRREHSDDHSGSEYEDIDEEGDMPSEVGNGSLTDAGIRMDETLVLPDGDGGADPDPGAGHEQEVGEPANFQRKAINNWKKWYPRNVKRSFMMCQREKRLTQNLIDAIENGVARRGCLLFGDRQGMQCGGVYVDPYGNQKRCDCKRQNCKEGEPRKVSIFTLNHGVISAAVVDWTCYRCGFCNKYRGYDHGLFPAEYGVVYTAELMYWYLHQMCYSTASFRGVYATYKTVHCAPSYQRRFQTGRARTIPGTHKGNRRFANKAIRKFIEQIDVEGTEVTVDKLYSCSKCEVPMDASDFTQLGLDSNKFKGVKRLHGIVIDAKVVPLLKEGTKEEDAHDVLHSVAGLQTKIITNRDRQNAISMFLSLVKSCVSRKRNERGQVSAGFVSTDGSKQAKREYLYEGGVLSIRLGAMKKHGSTKKQKRHAKVLEYMKVVRFYIDQNCCLCDGRNRTMFPNHAACASRREELKGTEGCTIMTSVFAAVFRNSANPLVVMDLVEGGEDGEEDGEEGEAEEEDSDFGADEHWVALNFTDFSCYEEQLESILDLMKLCTVEPVTLGFLPFHTEEGTMGNYENRTTLDVDGVEYGMPTENLDYTHLGPGGSVAANRIDEVLRACVRGLAKESVSLHRKVLAALRQLANCAHGNRSTTDWACPLCVDSLNADYKVVLLQNAILGRYIRDVIRHGRRHPIFTRFMATTMDTLIDMRIRSMEKYLEKLAKKMHPSSLNYWRQFGHCSLGSIQSRSEARRSPNATGPQILLPVMEINSYKDSLYVFPGRTRRRHGIDFDKVDRQDCTKNYFKGTSQIPSFMTVQCCCAKPKLLGFVILKQCESISAAISSVLTHFEIPPRRVWYDNACNAYDSALSRIPWYLRWTTMIVDRFHYTGHKCSNAFNGNLHRVLDDDRSVAAEVINAIIDKCSRHISYLEGRNVVPFMKVLFAHLNAMAHIREHIRRDDLEDEDLGQLLRDLFPCSCDNCQHGTDGAFGTEGDGVAVYTVRNEIEDIAQDPIGTGIELQVEPGLELPAEHDLNTADGDSDSDSDIA